MAVRKLLRARADPPSRDHILRAAERTFAEAGLSGARVDRIAARAGVNKALLYYYFRSKDGLYRAVLEEHLKAFARQARKVFAPPGDAESKVLGFVSAHFDFLSARPLMPSLMQRFFMTGGRSLDRLKAKYVLPTYRGLIRVIEQGVRDGELYEVDGRQTALSLAALVVHYFLAAPWLKSMARMDAYDRANLSARKQEVLGFVRRALVRRRSDE